MQHADLVVAAVGALRHLVEFRTIGDDLVFGGFIDVAGDAHGSSLLGAARIGRQRPADQFGATALTRGHVMRQACRP